MCKEIFENWYKKCNVFHQRREGKRKFYEILTTQSEENINRVRRKKKKKKEKI